MTTIQDIRAIHNPQKSYLWEVDIVGLSTGTLEDTAFFAKEVSIPPSSVETIVINHKSGRTAYSGRDSSDHSVSITFWDDETHQVYDFFQNWHDNLLRNPITGGGVTRDLYTADLIIKLQSTDEETVTQRIRLGHAFPTEIGEVSLSYESTDAVEFSVTFSYDEKVTGQ